MRKWGAGAVGGGVPRAPAEGVGLTRRDRLRLPSEPLGDQAPGGQQAWKGGVPVRAPDPDPG